MRALTIALMLAAVVVSCGDEPKRHVPPLDAPEEVAVPVVTDLSPYLSGVRQ